MLTSTILVIAIVPQGKGGGGWLPPVRQLLANFSFGKLDTNRDGSITPEELTKSTFDWLDKNSDKFVDGSELARMPAEQGAGGSKGREENNDKEKDKDKDKEKDGKKTGKQTIGPDETKKDKSNGGGKITESSAKYLEAWDTNKDNKLSSEEFRIPEGWFAQIDSDGDQKISKDEFLNKEKKDKEKDKEKAKDDGREKQDGKAKLAKLANMTTEEAMKELDKDGDGSISQEEWPLPKGFNVVDADGSGSLDKEEMASAVEFMKNMLKGKGFTGGKKKDGESSETGSGGSSGTGGTTGGKTGGEEKKPAPKPGENPPM